MSTSHNGTGFQFGKTTREGQKYDMMRKEKSDSMFTKMTKTISCCIQENKTRTRKGKKQQRKRKKRRKKKRIGGKNDVYTYYMRQSQKNTGIAN